jgi:transcriptional regulator with XRE-family HTH domain
MAERGFTVTEVADRMRQHLPDGENFATSNLSHYRQGRSVPRDGHLRALASALGVALTELTSAPDDESAGPRGASKASSSLVDNPAGVASASRPSVPENSSVIRIEDFGSEMRLVIDQRVPWEKAIQILNVLKGDGAS